MPSDVKTQIELPWLRPSKIHPGWEEKVHNVAKRDFVLPLQLCWVHHEGFAVTIGGVMLPKLLEW